jgi:hypothetical protein
MVCTALFTSLILEISLKKYDKRIICITDAIITALAFVSVFFDYDYIITTALGINIIIYILRGRKFEIVNQIGLTIVLIGFSLYFIDNPLLGEHDFNSILPQNLYMAYTLLPIIVCGGSMKFVWKNYSRLATSAFIASACLYTDILGIYAAVSNDITNLIIITLLLFAIVCTYALFNICNIRFNIFEKLCITSVMFVCAFMYSIIQPIKVADVIKLECAIIPYILFAFSLKLFWKEYRTIVSWIIFGIVTICMAVLGVDAMCTENPTDALIIGGIALIMLISSYLVLNLRWFVLSSVVILLLVIKMTAGFWTSIGWWIYLLIAGVILITFAAISEYNKTHDKKIRINIPLFNKKWKW